jgi:hypothetical protein
MLSPPLPWFGCNAIFLLSKKIKKYPKRLTPRQCQLYLGNIIRMQEEIGTGGGGFRFLYAAFLQEAATYLGNASLQQFSERYTHIGDKWRQFAYSAARLCKMRTSDLVSYDELGNMLREIGEAERNFFKDLKKLAL